MSKSNQSTKPTIKDVIMAHREHWMLLGAELEYTDALRAVCVRIGIQKGITDPAELARFCVDELGGKRWRQTFDIEEMEEVDGDPALCVRAYLALHDLFGNGWMKKAAEAYYEHEFDETHAGDRAQQVVNGANNRYEEFRQSEREAVARWLTRTAREQAALVAAVAAA